MLYRPGETPRRIGWPSRRYRRKPEISAGHPLNKRRRSMLDHHKAIMIPSWVFQVKPRLKLAKYDHDWQCQSHLCKAYGSTPWIAYSRWATLVMAKGYA